MASNSLLRQQRLTISLINKSHSFDIKPTTEIGTFIRDVSRVFGNIGLKKISFHGPDGVEVSQKSRFSHLLSAFHSVQMKVHMQNNIT
jgi:hypothetical protein